MVISFYYPDIKTKKCLIIETLFCFYFLYIFKIQEECMNILVYQPGF